MAMRIPSIAFILFALYLCRSFASSNDLVHPIVDDVSRFIVVFRPEVDQQEARIILEREIGVFRRSNSIVLYNTTDSSGSNVTGSANVSSPSPMNFTLDNTTKVNTTDPASNNFTVPLDDESMDSANMADFPEIQEIFQMGNFSGFSVSVKMNPELHQINFIKINRDPFSDQLLLIKDVNSTFPAVTLPRGLEFLQPYTPVIDFIERSTTVRPSAWLGQSNPTWNLRRISERVKNTNSYYIFDSIGGAGIDCYIIDSGINVANSDFEGRARVAVDYTGTGFDDTLGHGTHVAGIVGGRTYGVAKSANLIGVKVIGQSGNSDWSTVIAALNWVYRQAFQAGRRSIINLSVGGQYSAALTAAIKAVVDAGVVVVGAAGNDAVNACTRSPGASSDAIIVGATDLNDRLLSESNYGSCVDLLAPGGYIISDYVGSSTSIAAMT